MISFRIKPFESRNDRFIDVFIVSDSDAVYKKHKEVTGRPVGRSFKVHGVFSIYTDKCDRVTIKDGSYGAVILTREASSSVPYLVHEMTHAALHVAHAWKIDPTNDKGRYPHTGEEKFVRILENLVREYYFQQPGHIFFTVGGSHRRAVTDRSRNTLLRLVAGKKIGSNLKKAA